MDMKDFIIPELNKPWPAHTKESIADITGRQMPKIEKIKGLPYPAADIDYEGPIRIIREMLNDIARQQAAAIDKQTYEAVLRVGIQVDKEELIKALAYDRNQYTKGFNDGLKRSRASWVGIDEFPHEHYECNRCGYEHITDDISIFRYCPNCGAMMMDGKEEESRA